MEKEIVVAVYGSLKRGFDNHHVLGDADFLGTYTTDPFYTMIHMGDYPGLLAGGSTAIDVELYHVTPSMLEKLDELEDVPRLYRRSDICVPDFGEAYLYVLSDEHAKTLGDYQAQVIESGHWD